MSRLPPTVERRVDESYATDRISTGTGKWMNSKRRVGTGVALALLVLGLLGPLIAPFDPVQVDLTATGLPPGYQHVLGTDRLGRDVLSRWLLAAQISIAVALAAGAIASSVGVVIGLIAGSRRGPVGAMLDRALDAALSVPVFFVAVAIQSVLPPGPAPVALLLGLVGWMAPARVFRGEALRIRSLDFVDAARALGAGESRLLTRHVLPHCTSAVAAVFTTSFADALLTQSVLSFIGIGLIPPTPTWGGMLQESMPELARGAWWLTVIPGLSIMAAAGLVGRLADLLNSDRRNGPGHMRLDSQ